MEKEQLFVHRKIKYNSENISYGSIPPDSDNTISIMSMKTSRKLSTNKRNLHDFIRQGSDILFQGYDTFNRERISRFLDFSVTGLYIDISRVIVSITYIIIYIRITYLNLPIMPFGLWIFELFLCFLLLLDYIIIKILLSENRISYFFTAESFITLIVILPVIPSSFFFDSHTLWSNPTYWRLLYPFRCVKALIDIRVIINRCHVVLTPIRQSTLKAYVLIICFIVVAAGIIQVSELASKNKTLSNLPDTSPNWNFFYCFYNAVLLFVTIQTPPADSMMSQIFVGLLAILFLILVPYQVSEISTILSSFSTYELNKAKISKNSRYIILCGELTPTRIKSFFNEVFHDDHDFVDIRVIVLYSEDPNVALTQLLMDPFYSKRVCFLKGSILEIQDVQRSAIHMSSGVFILSQKEGQESLNISDHHTLMRTISSCRLAPGVPIYVQTHLLKNKKLLEDSGAENVFCFNEMIYSIMAQSCICPGFSTIITNLTSTSNDGEINENWKAKYIHGASHEIYPATLPPSSVIFGLSFSQVASIIYETCANTLLLAVEIDDGKTKEIFLNPENSYICHGNEKVYVISRNRREAERVKKITYQQIQECEVINEKEFKYKPILLPQQTTSEDSPQSSKYNTNLHFSNEEKTNCKRKIEDCIINDVKELHMTGRHVVVCSLSKTWLDNIIYFLAPLRSPKLKRQMPVIFLTCCEPDEDNWNEISIYENIFIIIGSPFLKSSYKKCGMENAHRIFIFSGEGEESSFATNELLLDSSIVAVHKSIVSMLGPLKAPSVVTELMNRSNVHYLSYNMYLSGWFNNKDDEDESNFCEPKEISYETSPAFVSGLMYSSSLCDNFMINSFFNPKLSDIVREFIFTSWQHKILLTDHPNEEYNNLLNQNINDNEFLLNLNHQRSSMYTCEVPKEFIGKTFSYMFHYMISSDGILVFGLYRNVPLQMRNIHSIENLKQNIEKISYPPYGYVYVSPYPNEIILDNDLMYILATKQPRWQQ